MKLSDQLKEYLENTPKEQLEQDWFEIQCKCEDIDPNDPNAKAKLKWKMFKNELFSNRVKATLTTLMMILCFVTSGLNIKGNNIFLAIVMFLCGGFWLKKLIDYCKYL